MDHAAGVAESALEDGGSGSGASALIRAQPREAVGPLGKPAVHQQVECLSLPRHRFGAPAGRGEGGRLGVDHRRGPGAQGRGLFGKFHCPDLVGEGSVELGRGGGAARFEIQRAGLKQQLSRYSASPSDSHRGWRGMMYALT